MKNFSAQSIIRIADALHDCRLTLTGIVGDVPYSSEAKHQVKGSLVFVKQMVHAIGLNSSEIFVARIIEESDACGNEEVGDLLNRIGALAERIDDELTGMRLLYLEPSRYKYYAPEEPLFGECVTDNFPSATYDIEEAGKCFALGRYTAAVMHLMRVLEVALQVMRESLKVPFSERKSWNAVLIDLESKRKLIESRKRKPKSWRNDRQFYSEAFVEFDHMKDAWRNHSMHARDKYDEERAENVLNHVQRLMRHLATRLKEYPKKPVSRSRAP